MFTLSCTRVSKNENANDTEGRSRQAPRAAGGQVAQALRQSEDQTQASPSPQARPLRSASQAPAAKAPRQSAGRKRKTTQQPAAPAAQPGALGSTTLWLSSHFRTYWQAAQHQQSLPLLVHHIQRLVVDLGKVRAFEEKTYNQLQQERQANALQLEHLLRHFKWNNLGFQLHGHSLPAELARHVQGVLFQIAPASGLTTVRSAYWLGKWKQAQGSVGGVDVSCCQPHSIVGIQSAQS